MKRTAFGIAALLLLSATPCVVNAFTAIAWSQSGQKGGSVKNAPTKEAAISAAIADCKKSGGGSDCQVFKVTDEPGFVALYATCAKTCGVTAVTGRATAEQARADGKRECEAYYGASCQLAQEWEEVVGNNVGNFASPSQLSSQSKTYSQKNSSKIGQNGIALPGEKYLLLVNKPPFSTGPFGFGNSPNISTGRNDQFTESSARFIARFENYGSGVSYFVKIKDSIKTIGKVGTTGVEFAKQIFETSGLKFSNATPLDVPQPEIPGAMATAYFASGIPFDNVMHGQKAVYVYSVILPEKGTAYALMTSVLTPINNDVLKKANFKFDPKNISAAYSAAFSDIMTVTDGRKDKTKDFQVNIDGISEAVVYGKGAKYWEKKFSDNILYQKAGAVACQDGSFPEKRKISDMLPLLVCQMYLLKGGGLDNSIEKYSEAEEYVQLIDEKQNLARSQEALDFLSGTDKTQIKNDLTQSVELAGAAMKWLMKNVELQQSSK